MVEHCLRYLLYVCVYRGVVKVWLGVAVATPSLASQAKPMVQNFLGWTIVII